MKNIDSKSYIHGILLTDESGEIFFASVGARALLGICDLKGKDVVFKCKIHEVKEEELPELDDEFAMDVSEFDTLEEFKKDLKAKLQTQKEEYSLSVEKNKALEAVCDMHEFEIPEVMIEEEITYMVRDFENQLQGQGLTLDKYLEILKKEEKDFREEMRGEATKRLKVRMVVDAIVQKEKFEASEEEFELKVKELATQYGMEVDKLKEAVGMEALSFLKKDIAMSKAIDYIREKAVVVDKK